MDETVLQEIFEELFSAMEALETQNGAMLQFLKKQGLLSDEEFAQYLESAAKPSNVRWRATRVRVNHLLTAVPTTKEVPNPPSPSASETKKDQQAAGQSSEEHKGSAEPAKPAKKTALDLEAEKDQAAQRQTEDRNPKAEESAPEKSAKDKPAKKDAA